MLLILGLEKIGPRWRKLVACSCLLEAIVMVRLWAMLAQVATTGRQPLPEVLPIGYFILRQE